MKTTLRKIDVIIDKKTVEPVKKYWDSKHFGFGYGFFMISIVVVVNPLSFFEQNFDF